MLQDGEGHLRNFLEPSRTRPKPLEPWKPLRKLPEAYGEPLEAPQAPETFWKPLGKLPEACGSLQTPPEASFPFQQTSETRKFVHKNSVSLLYLKKALSRPPGAPGRGRPLWKLSEAFRTNDFFECLARNAKTMPKTRTKRPKTVQNYECCERNANEQRKIRTRRQKRRTKYECLEPNAPSPKKNYECLERNASALSETAQAPENPLGASRRASRSL